MRWKRKQPRSPWREFAFMHHQVLQAVVPPLNLNTALKNWPNHPGNDPCNWRVISKGEILTASKQVSAYGTLPPVAGR
jgi:hypothetical protein